MNRKKTALLTLALTGAFAVGVCANGVVQDITAQLRPDLTIKVAGQPQTFADANGNTVYPIMYNGTTYLPVRGIGQLFQQAIDWDGETQTVTVGEKDAFASLITLPGETDGWAGNKIMDATTLTFPYGDLQEPKTFSSGIQLNEINSAAKEYAIKLDKSYATMNVTLHNPAASQYAATLRVRNKDTDVVVFEATLEPGQFKEGTNINLGAAQTLVFQAEGSAGGNDTVYFLNPEVR